MEDSTYDARPYIGQLTDPGLRAVFADLENLYLSPRGWYLLTSVLFVADSLEGFTVEDARALGEQILFAPESLSAGQYDRAKERLLVGFEIPAQQTRAGMLKILGEQ